MDTASHKASRRHRSTRFIRRYIIRGTLAIAGFLAIANGGNVVIAQSSPSGAVNSGSVNFDNIPSEQFNDIQPIRQYGLPVDSGGSQQFFQQNNSRLYFLPQESESESILKIDKTIEAEGISYEDLQRQNIDR